MALTHNLLLIYEHRLEQHHAVSNAAEDRRRAKRVAELQRISAQAGRATSTLLSSARRASQRSLKFIRWLRHALQENLTEAAAVPHLTTLYASL